MKRATAFPFAVALALGGCAGATRERLPEPLLDQLIRAEHSWASALRARDSVALDAIMTDDYTLNGRVPKREWMANSLHRLNVDTIGLSAFELVETRGDTAVIDLNFYWRATLDGGPGPDTTHRLRDTWIRSTTGWRVVLRQVLQLRVE